MDSLDKDKNDCLNRLLEQSWLHIRHTESHRLWFTNIYFLVVAGVLTYLSTQDPEFIFVVYPALAIFMLWLAILGLIICYKTTYVFNAFNKAIENMLRDMLGSKKNLRRYFAHIPLRERRKGIRRRAEAISLTYKLLYITSIIMWIALLVIPYWQS